VDGIRRGREEAAEDEGAAISELVPVRHMSFVKSSGLVYGFPWWATKGLKGV